MEKVVDWAVKRSPEKLTREEFLREFAARVPHLAGKLEAILRAYGADGTFGRLRQLVLGDKGA